ncbi:MAG TPA: hypothetical protein VHJ20_17425 [Polyangia bacterium]|nr:hypothetical protein [Polyangia bacterium]
MKILGTTTLAAVLLLGARAARADFSYTLSSPLKPTAAGQCAGTDVDNDCLDDAMETQLAGIVSPYYFWDETDSCNYYSSTDADTAHGSTAGYAQNVPRYYYQVRPIKKTGAPAGYPLNIRTWQANTGWIYWVRIHYFFNYPTDCGWTGHQGDNEGTFYDLYSTDLQTWSIGSGFYPRHTDPVHVISGTTLQQMSAGAGGYYPMVLADDHGHGSWEGLSPQSTSCGVGAQGNLTINYYCLVGPSLTWARQNGQYIFPDTTKNIGEPALNGSSGAWNTSVMNVYGNPAYPGTNVTSLEYTASEWATNPYANMYEYWNDVSATNPAYNRFCGWECGAGPKYYVDTKTGQRTMLPKTCQANVLNQQDCSEPMWSKVEKAPFDKCLPSGGSPCAAGSL